VHLNFLYPAGICSISLCCSAVFLILLLFGAKVVFWLSFIVCCGVNWGFDSAFFFILAELSFIIITLLPGNAKQFEQTRAFLFGSIFSSLALNFKLQLLHCITKRLKSSSMVCYLIFGGIFIFLLYVLIEVEIILVVLFF